MTIRKLYIYVDKRKRTAIVPMRNFVQLILFNKDDHDFKLTYGFVH